MLNARSMPVSAFQSDPQSPSKADLPLHANASTHPPAAASASSKSREDLAEPSSESLATSASTTLTDDELMLRVAAGCRSSFACLMHRYWKPTASLCVKIVLDENAGQELAQETWMDLWRGAARFEPRGEFAAYVRKIARRRCFNWLRDENRRPRGHASPVETLIASGQRDPLETLTLRHAVTSLDAHQRELLALRFEHGLSFEEIAVELAAPASTLRSRAQHALTQLRKKLGDLW